MSLQISGFTCHFDGRRITSIGGDVEVAVVIVLVGGMLVVIIMEVVVFSIV